MTAGRDDTVVPGPAWQLVLADARADDTVRDVRSLIRLCESVIVGAGLSGFNSMGSARKDADALVFETLSIRDHHARYLDAVVTAVERAAILDLLERRVSGPTPVPYLTGEAFFAGRRFSVKPGVFIPRSALGTLLDEVVADTRWSETPRALELGCGSGALGLSIAIRIATVHVDLVDIDELAVEVTRANIERHGLADRARAEVGDLYGGVEPSARYDLVVANLPYVPQAMQGRGAGEIDAEPAAAVFRAGDGLDLVRSAIAQSPLHLSDEGTLVLEVGVMNEEPIRQLLAGRGRWWVHEGQATGVVSLTRDELKA